MRFSRTGAFPDAALDQHGVVVYEIPDRHRDVVTANDRHEAPVYYSEQPHSLREHQEVIAW